MNYTSEKMMPKNAHRILEWRYDKPYDTYNFEETEEAIDELLNQNFFSIYESGDLVGYYCYGISAQVPSEETAEIYSDESYVDVGLGMRPNLTGMGGGKLFFEYILQDIKNIFPDKKLRLTVASFNKRAIKVYESSGFKYVMSFTPKSSELEFKIMIQD